MARYIVSLLDKVLGAQACSSSSGTARAFAASFSSSVLLQGALLALEEKYSGSAIAQLMNGQAILARGAQKSVVRSYNAYKRLAVRRNNSQRVQCKQS